MTDSREKDMPDVLYIEKNIHGFYDAFGDKQHVPLTHYTHTARLLERVRGLRKTQLHENPEKAAEVKGRNAALQDVEKILGGGK